MKIYTKTGDDGTTGLIGGRRVSKSDPRIECTGSVDELNAAIGVAVVSADGELREKLRRVQDELFVVGSHLASPDAKSAAGLPALEESSITRLEKEIDAATGELAPLKNFILPGDGDGGAAAFGADGLSAGGAGVGGVRGEQPEMGGIVKYLNRLSDWLFVQARRANWRAGAVDIEWKS